MDKISKALAKLNAKERMKAKEILNNLQNRKFDNLEIKKLQGYNNIFRVRKGKIRIIYRVKNDGSIFILTVERRSDTTYNF
ncbi:MAG: hypothetical protein M0Q92_08755 [Methanoregula sp.]|jgi:mRNA-degrading endonuclease RelE of RelBE toxin-antitoxin system|nr:hypothetical protein [Methanoregula sp.]